MGWLKRAAKRVWHAVKAVVRTVVRVAATVWGVVVGLPDLLLGFLLPAKKLRIHVIILDGPTDASPTLPVPTRKEIEPRIAFAKKVFKERFNVDLLPYAPVMIESITGGVPKAAMDVGCGWSGLGNEYGEAGEFFNSHLAGWNAAPVSAAFPITVFVVSDIDGKGGCSMGPLTDYITIDRDSVFNGSLSTLAHELGHACNLWHSLGKSNLMWADGDRGDTVHWWQKNLARASRHVTWW